MAICPQSPQNWSKTFTIWIQDIQVQFNPQSVGRAIRGGTLSKIQTGSRLSAALVAALFCLHCTRPHVAVQRSTPPATSGAANAEVSLYTESGDASWYGDQDSNRFTANGEVFNPELRTCAHRSLPFGTLLEVENLRNGFKVMVRVNDRGPFIRGRILDLSPKAAMDLGFASHGVAPVEIRLIQPAGFLRAREQSVTSSVQLAPLSRAGATEQLLKEIQPLSYGGLARNQAPRVAHLKQFRAASLRVMSNPSQMADDGSRNLKESTHDLLPFITREY
jgi:rare lipoprotein A